MGRRDVHTRRAASAGTRRPSSPQITSTDTGTVSTALNQDPLAAPATLHNHHGSSLLFVIDQFEELFTMCDDEDDRERFISLLHALAAPAPKTGTAAARVVIGVRADFYGRCARYPQLAETLATRQVLVGPMTPGQLRMTIERPAQLAGLILEPGLADAILRDLRAGRKTGADLAGELPLLSHVLLATWQRATWQLAGSELTIADYEAAGRIGGALARTADDIYESFGTAAQDMMRGLLPALIVWATEARYDRRIRQNLPACREPPLLDHPLPHPYP